MHFDYAFLRNEEGGEKATVLVGPCRQSKFLIAHVVPSKGESEDWVVAEVVKDRKKMGHNGQVLLRGDQERALGSFLYRVAEARGQVAVLEIAPKGDSKGNGIAERAVQQVEEMVRAHKPALENAVGQRIPIGHPCIPWLVQHAADLVNRFRVMKDGTTAYQPVKKRKSSSEMHEFCFPLLHCVSGEVQGRVMAERCYEGLWLGKHFASGEDLVSMEDGLVVRARTTKERPASVKLSMEMLSTVTGLTWKPSSTLCDTQPLDFRAPDGHANENPEFEEASGRVPYRVHINKAVFEKVGYSPGCSKCAAMRRGDKSKTKSGHHTDECRSRVEKGMLNHESLRKMAEDATRRQNEWLAKRIELEEKKHGVRNFDSGGSCRRERTRSCTTSACF